MLAPDARKSTCEFDMSNQLLLNVDALLHRKILLQLYMTATAEKHFVWCINLLNEQDSMWYKNFDQKMRIVDK